MQIKKIDVNKIVTFFLLAHLIIWTLIPSISNNNLPLDTIEALAWGSDLNWGYNKHPPLSAWSVEVFYQIFGNQDWVYYFLSQLFVVTAFFIIFKFSEDLFKNKTYSLISILLLEGIYFYNFTTPEFNVNVCQLPFWALTVFYCWKGFKQNDNVSWLLLGSFAALGVLSKYLFIYLLISLVILFIYAFIKKEFNFKCLISLISFFIILSPHLIWLIVNDYNTVNYALYRTGLEESNLLNHLFYPLIFLGKQIGILIPFFVMFFFIVSKLKTKINFKDKKLIFLITINVIPIILMLLTSLIMGAKIRTIWMTPFYLYMGVLFVYIFRSKIVFNKFKYFVSIFLILFVLSPTAYYFVSITQTDKRTDYPGKKIAKLVHQEWDNIIKSDESIIHKKIEVVAWDEWYAGNLSYHLGGVERPRVYILYHLVEVERPKVYINNFNNTLAYEKEKNFILITKKKLANKVCYLTSKRKTKYLAYIKNVAEHNVCFLILKEDK